MSRLKTTFYTKIFVLLGLHLASVPNAFAYEGCGTHTKFGQVLCRDYKGRVVRNSYCDRYTSEIGRRPPVPRRQCPNPCCTETHTVDGVLVGTPKIKIAGSCESTSITRTCEERGDCAIELEPTCDEIGNCPPPRQVANPVRSRPEETTIVSNRLPDQPAETYIIAVPSPKECSDPTACTLFDERVLGNYQAMFGRNADAEGALFWTNQKHQLIASQGMSEQEADAKIEKQMLDAGLASGENIVSISNSRNLKISDMPTDSMYSDRVLGNYETIFGREADGPGALFYTNIHHDLVGSGLSQAEADKELDRLMVNAGRNDGEAIHSSGGSSTPVGTGPSNVSAISQSTLELYDNNLDRPADGQGGLFWEQQKHSTVSKGISVSTAKSQIEAQFREGARNNQEQPKTTSFVQDLYSSELGREADDAGAKFWDGVYDSYVADGMDPSAAQNKVKEQFIEGAKNNDEL